MEAIKKALRPAGWVLSIALALSGYASSAAGLTSYGLPFWAWGTIGLALFFAMVLATIYWPRQKLQENITMEFYEDRDRMIGRRGGLAGDLKKASTVWVGMETGAYLGSIDRTNVKRIKRILLLNPQSPPFKSLSDIPGYGETILSFHIKQAVGIAKNEGIEVKLSNKSILNVVIADPETPQTWVRVQAFIPNLEPAYWPNYIVTRTDYPKLVDRIEKAYDTMWKNKNNTKTPEEVGL